MDKFIYNDNWETEVVAQSEQWELLPFDLELSQIEKD